MIEIKGVTKRFGSHRILDNLSLTIPGGESLFILGRSGAGKSILLKSLVGLVPIDSGEIWFENQRIDNLTEQELFPVRRRMSLCFQHPCLFNSLTVKENVGFGLRPDNLSKEDKDARVALALKWVGFPIERSNESVLTLSQSEGKRVSLARTLVLQPKVILFDEPTTSLDPGSSFVFFEQIDKLSKVLGFTPVFVSHDVKGALQWADRVAFVHEGAIRASFTPDSIQSIETKSVREFIEAGEWAD